MARQQDAGGLDHSQRGGLALRFARRRGDFSQHSKPRAGRDQLRLARVRHPRRPVAYRRRLDAAGVKATVALNSQFCETFPKAMEEMKKRGWEFMGHGTTNSESLAGLAPDKEREVIRHVLSTIEQATGRKPRGWLGAGLNQTYNTLDILAEEGVTYCGDWNNDDQPYPMKVKAGKLFAIPYCMEINDIPLFIRKGYTGEQYYRSVLDQFEQLYADSEKQPRVLGIPLHPMIIGQPLRIKYLERVLAEIKKHERLWFATGTEIIDAYERAHPTG